MSLSEQPTDRETDEQWMRIALQEAVLAAREGEVPIGAVAVLEGELVASDHNRTVQLNDPSAHAEMIVIRRAAEALGNYRLNGLEVYVTVEPCPMCAGVLVWARVGRLVYGTRDDKAGAIHSRVQLLEEGLFNHTVKVSENVLAEPCREVLRQFFRVRR